MALSVSVFLTWPPTPCQVYYHTQYHTVLTALYLYWWLCLFLCFSPDPQHHVKCITTQYHTVLTALYLYWWLCLFLCFSTDPQHHVKCITTHSIIQFSQHCTDGSVCFCVSHLTPNTMSSVLPHSTIQFSQHCTCTDGSVCFCVSHLTPNTMSSVLPHSTIQFSQHCTDGSVCFCVSHLTPNTMSSVLSHTVPYSSHSTVLMALSVSVFLTWPSTPCQLYLRDRYSQTLSQVALNTETGITYQTCYLIPSPMLTPGQPVPALTLWCQAPCKAA